MNPFYFEDSSGDRTGKSGERPEYVKQAGTDFACFIMRLLVLCYNTHKRLLSIREIKTIHYTHPNSLNKSN